MSGYTELRELGVAFVAPDGPMPRSGNRYPQFSASWSQTVELYPGAEEFLRRRRGWATA